MKYRNFVVELISVALIILWTYAAFSKLFAFDIFRYQLSKSPLLTPFAGLMAIIIPSVELILAGMLIVTKLKKIGILLSATLLAIFTIYLIGMLAFSSEIPCSCGGIISNFTWRQHVYFNLAFLFMASIGYWLQRKNKNDQKREIPFVNQLLNEKP